jgi:hypothetical protein
MAPGKEPPAIITSLRGAFLSLCSDRSCALNALPEPLFHASHNPSVETTVIFTQTNNHAVRHTVIDAITKLERERYVIAIE